MALVPPSYSTKARVLTLSSVVTNLVWYGWEELLLLTVCKVNKGGEEKYKHDNGVEITEYGKDQVWG